MALNTLIDELKNLDGYVAFAMMRDTGEVLAADDFLSEQDVAIFGKTFNEVFGASHAQAGKSGFNSLEGSVVATTNTINIMACSGVNSPVHLHFMVMLEPHANQAVAKMLVEKIANQALSNH